MSEQKSYRLFENMDDEFHLKPCTFGLYEKLKMVQLKCTAIPAVTKKNIMAEFNIPSEDQPDSSFGVEELYKFYIENMFLDIPEKFDIKDVVLREVVRAASDFFALGGSN